MEHVEHMTGTKTFTTHKFYCDDCGEFIGSATEWDDGWYRELGEFDLKFHTPLGWYKLKKTLCDSCKEKVLNKLVYTLIEVGFERVN